MSSCSWYSTLIFLLIYSLKFEIRDKYTDFYISVIGGLDISNITFVETISSNGVIVIDPLTFYECAQKALQMYFDERGEKTIVAIIHTHSHADHFGGGKYLESISLIPRSDYFPRVSRKFIN